MLLVDRPEFEKKCTNVYAGRMYDDDTREQTYPGRQQSRKFAFWQKRPKKYFKSQKNVWDSIGTISVPLDSISVPLGRLGRFQGPLFDLELDSCEPSARSGHGASGVVTHESSPEFPVVLLPLWHVCLGQFVLTLRWMRKTLEANYVGVSPQYINNNRCCDLTKQKKKTFGRIQISYFPDDTRWSGKSSGV